MTGDTAAGRVPVGIRSAVPSDLPAVVSLLEAEALPVAGVDEWLTHYLVADVDGGVAGVAGLEVYGDGALLRSVAVRTDMKGRGIGGRLVDEAIARARAGGVPSLWLLTTTAERWFPRHGFEMSTRSAVPPGVRESVEFREACPETAAVMVLRT